VKNILESFSDSKIAIVSIPFVLQDLNSDLNNSILEYNNILKNLVLEFNNVVYLDFSEKLFEIIKNIEFNGKVEFEKYNFHSIFENVFISLNENIIDSESQSKENNEILNNEKNIENNENNENNEKNNENNENNENDEKNKKKKCILKGVNTEYKNYPKFYMKNIMNSYFTPINEISKKSSLLFTFDGIHLNNNSVQILLNLIIDFIISIK
jgi:hypothetical protein